MDTLEPIIIIYIYKCPDYQGFLIFQVSLYDKAFSVVWLKAWHFQQGMISLGLS